MLLNNREAAAKRLVTIERKQTEYMQRYSADTRGTFPWELVEREVKRLEAEKVQWHVTLDELDERLAFSLPLVTCWGRAILLIPTVCANNELRERLLSR